MLCGFRGRRSTLDAFIIILRGRRSTLDASCCVFFANRIGRAASSGNKLQIPWHVWHFVRCDENWRKPRTKHRLWGCRFWSYKVWKLREKSRTKCSFWCSQRVSSRVSGFPVASPCLWGKLQNLSCFEGFQAGCYVVLRGRRGTLWYSNLFFWFNVSKVVLCGRRKTFAPFSQDELQFSWQEQHFGDLCRHFAWQAQHFRRVALRALHSTLHALHSTLRTLHFTLHNFTFHTPHFTPPHYTWDFESTKGALGLMLKMILFMILTVSIWGIIYIYIF